MDFISLTSLTIIIITVLTSYQGLKDEFFFKKHLFNVDKILIEKEFYRTISVGFLHNDWFHLLFNMAALHSFSEVLEMHLGPVGFLLIYFISLLGGSLFTLYVHREHGDYSAVGASGAVCGVVFATIALYGGSVSFFGSPSIPAWLYGSGYILYSICGISKKAGNVCHEGHFGGALCGLFVALVFVPAALFANLLTISLIVIPSVVFIYIILTRPEVLIIGLNALSGKKKYYDIDDAYNANRVDKQKEMDRILEKISKRGINSLSQSEKDFLDGQ